MKTGFPFEPEPGAATVPLYPTRSNPGFHYNAKLWVLGFLNKYIPGVIVLLNIFTCNYKHSILGSCPTNMINEKALKTSPRRSKTLTLDQVFSEIQFYIFLSTSCVGLANRAAMMEQEKRNHFQKVWGLKDSISEGSVEWGGSSESTDLIPRGLTGENTFSKIQDLVN